MKSVRKYSKKHGNRGTVRGRKRTMIGRKRTMIGRKRTMRGRKGSKRGRKRITRGKKGSKKKRYSKKLRKNLKGGSNRQDVLIDTMCYDLDDADIKDTKIYKLIKGLCNTRFVPQSTMNNNNNNVVYQEQEKVNKKSSNAFVRLLKSTGNLLTLPASIAINTMNKVTGLGGQSSSEKKTNSELEELNNLKEINYKLKNNLN